MSAAFIDDGYTLTRTIQAAPGLYPEVVVKYRPGLRRDRLDHGKVFGGSDPAKVDTFEAALIERHVVEFGGEPFPKGKARRLHPELQKLLLDLVLCYEPADAGEGDEEPLPN